MSHPAVTPARKVLLDEESIRRTLSRIAHEIIERNEELDTVALVGIHTRGVPIAQRLRRLVEERSGEELAIGQLDITFHRDDQLCVPLERLAIHRGLRLLRPTPSSIVRPAPPL